ncbi:MAG: ATPase, T2SS/T4P/T4SS family [Patescibacteria group bacterium]
MQSAWLNYDAQSDDERRHALAHELGVPFVTLERHDVDPEALALIPEPLSRAHNILAYRTRDGAVEVALLDLESLAALEPLKSHLPRMLPRLTTEATIKNGLLRYQQLLKEKFAPLLAEVRHPVRLLRGLISHALASGASTIHLDPGPEQLRVRYRIGGVLYEALVLPKEAHASLANAVPSSGSGTVELGFADAARVRVHVAPSVHGKKIVIHAVREGTHARSPESLGLHGEALDRLHRALSRRSGLVLVTGVGKSTLLDSLQGVVDGVHLATAAPTDAPSLRAALKADPDMVVMDDVPDRESARLLASAAKRGIFVLASAADDIAQELSPDVSVACAVVARLCAKQFHNTKKLSRAEGEVFERYTSFAPIFNALKEEGVIPQGASWKDVVFAHPVPCGDCEGGYRGRVGIYEVADQGEVVGLTLAEDALFKAAEGLTSIEEALGLVESLG